MQGIKPEKLFSMQKLLANVYIYRVFQITSRGGGKSSKSPQWRGDRKFCSGGFIIIIIIVVFVVVIIIIIIIIILSEKGIGQGMVLSIQTFCDVKSNIK